MKQINEIMTASPKTCKKTDSLQSVASQMSKSNIGFLPVVDENQKVIGTITDRDVTITLGKTNKSATELKVQDAMASDVQTISTSDDAATALKVMRTRQVGRLPVVDTERRLKGVVSLMGIAREIKNTTDRTELEHAGKENIMNTLIALADRNKTLTPVD